MDKARLEKFRAMVKKAHREHLELKRRLDADKSGPKPGDVYYVDPDLIGCPVHPEYKVKLSVEWLVTVIHPDDANLFYMLAFDMMGFPIPSFTDVDTGSGVIIRCNAGAWVAGDFLQKIGRRFMYVDAQFVNAAHKKLAAMVSGGLKTTPDEQSIYDDMEYEERENQCVGMANALHELALAMEDPMN